MRVLVTGAPGNDGGYVVQHLLRRGADVVALTRNRSAAHLPCAAKVVEADLADPTSLRRALEGVQAVHLITFTGDNNEPQTHARALVDELAAADVRFVTLLEGNLDTAPLRQSLSAANIGHSMLCPVEFMDNALWWQDQIRAGTVREGFVDVPSTVVHASDIGEVAAACLIEQDTPGQPLWITGGEALTPRQRLRIISHTTGRQIRLVELTEQQVTSQWARGGLNPEGVEFLLRMRKFPPHYSQHPASTVLRMTGHHPIPFSAFVQEHRNKFTPWR